MAIPIPQPWSRKLEWAKTRFIEYTDDTFTTPKPQPEWLGILGPVIRAEVGDEIVVDFLNRSRRGHDMHPHGLRYDKSNEGCSLSAGCQRSFRRSRRPLYLSLVCQRGSGPGPGQPSSIVWWYHAHVDAGIEINAGLLGPIIVTAKGKANPDGSPKDVDREFVASFMIFNEMGGKPAGQFYAINGFIFGNLPGLTMKQGDKVRWYLLGMGNEIDLHTPHWHGETVTDGRRNTDVIELLPGSMADRGHARRQSRNLDVSLPCGRSHGGRNDGGLYHLRSARARLPAGFRGGRFLEASGKLFADGQEHQPKPITSLRAHVRDVSGASGFAATVQRRVVIGQAHFARPGANSGKAGHSRRQRPVRPGLGLLPGS